MSRNDMDCCKKDCCCVCVRVAEYATCAIVKQAARLCALTCCGCECEPRVHTSACFACIEACRDYESGSECCAAESEMLTKCIECCLACVRDHCCEPHHA